MSGAMSLFLLCPTHQKIFENAKIVKCFTFLAALHPVLKYLTTIQVENNKYM